MVTSTVHLTGSPADDIKEAMSRLLSRSTNKFCSKKGKWLGDPEVRGEQRLSMCDCVRVMCFDPREFIRRGRNQGAWTG